MQILKAGFDDIGAIVFVLYIVISVIQSIFKKQEPEGGANEPPEPFQWDEEITYDANGQPVKKSPGPAKAEPPKPAPKRQPEIPKDPYGILTGGKKPRRPVPPPAEPRMPPAPRRAERPKQDSGWRSTEDARESRETARETRETARAERETAPERITADARETASEHRHREVKPETSGTSWGEVFSSHEQSSSVLRAQSARATAAALQKASARRTPAPKPAVAGSPAAELVRMLRNPRSAAAAVLAAEVLGPPVGMRRRRPR